jgi:hypothetical protein
MENIMSGIEQYLEKYQSKKKYVTTIKITDGLGERTYGWAADMERGGSSVMVSRQIMVAYDLRVGDVRRAQLVHDDGYINPRADALLDEPVPTAPVTSAEPAPPTEEEKAARIGWHDHLLRSVRDSRNHAMEAANKADILLKQIINDEGKPEGWHYTPLKVNDFPLK